MFVCAQHIISIVELIRASECVFSFPKKAAEVSFSFVHRLPGFRYEVECEENAMGAAVKSLDVTYRSKGKMCAFFFCKGSLFPVQISLSGNRRGSRPFRGFPFAYTPAYPNDKAISCRVSAKV